MRSWLNRAHLQRLVRPHRSTDLRLKLGDISSCVRQAQQIWSWGPVKPSHRADGDATIDWLPRGRHGSDGGSQPCSVRTPKRSKGPVGAQSVVAADATGVRDPTVGVRSISPSSEIRLQRPGDTFGLPPSCAIAQCSLSPNIAHTATGRGQSPISSTSP
jgi:hypothetical protein